MYNCLSGQDVSQAVMQAASKKIRVHPKGVEHLTICFLVHMLYH